MDEGQTDVGSTPATGMPVEGWMLREDIVREVLARLARGEHVKAIARELGIDKKTIDVSVRLVREDLRSTLH